MMCPLPSCYNTLCTSQCLKIKEKVSFYIASEASYVFILSRQKFIKNAKIENLNETFLGDFQTMCHSIYIYLRLYSMTDCQVMNLIQIEINCISIVQSNKEFDLNLSQIQHCFNADLAVNNVLRCEKIRIARHDQILDS